MGTPTSATCGAEPAPTSIHWDWHLGPPGPRARPAECPRRGQVRPTGAVEGGDSSRVVDPMATESMRRYRSLRPTVGLGSRPGWRTRMPWWAGGHPGRPVRLRGVVERPDGRRPVRCVDMGCPSTPGNRRTGLHDSGSWAHQEGHQAQPVAFDRRFRPATATCRGSGHHHNHVITVDTRNPDRPPAGTGKDPRNQQEGQRVALADGGERRVSAR
jgi:hypothetical protein